MGAAESALQPGQGGAEATDGSVKYDARKQVFTRACKSCQALQLGRWCVDRVPLQVSVCLLLLARVSHEPVCVRPLALSNRCEPQQWSCTRDSKGDRKMLVLSLCLVGG